MPRRRRLFRGADAVTLRDVDNLVRRAYLSLRFDAFDLEVGKKFVRWGKVDFLSPLDVVNHVNAEVPALGARSRGCWPTRCCTSPSIRGMS